MNRINKALTRDISPEEFDLVSGGSAASDDVVEEQIETVVVSGSYGGVSSGTINSLGANYGGGYGSFLQGYVPGAVGTAAVAAAHNVGNDLIDAGEWTGIAGASLASKAPYLSGILVSAGGFMMGSGKLLLTIER